MPFKWSPDDCQKLIWHILAKSDFKPNSEVFASAAETLGGGLNANACSQKFYKLKRESEALLDEGGNIAALPSTPNATKKKSATTPKTGASTGKGRKRKIEDEPEASDDNENAVTDKTPSKKASESKKKRTEQKMKAEADED